MGQPIMAKALTRDFEIFVDIAMTTTANNQTLDLTDYVDIADNQAFEVHELDLILNPTTDFPAADVVTVLQVADSNLTAFVSHATRTSLYVSRQTYETAPLSMYEQTSFPSLTPLIVSKTLWARNECSTGTMDMCLRVRGRIVTPSAKDYIALVLTQTGNVA